MNRVEETGSGKVGKGFPPFLSGDLYDSKEGKSVVAYSLG